MAKPSPYAFVRVFHFEQSFVLSAETSACIDVLLVIRAAEVGILFGGRCTLVHNAAYR